MELSLAPVENNAESLGKPSCSIRGHPLAIRRINTAASGVPIPQLVGSTTSRSLRRCCSMDTDLSQPHRPHLRSLIDSVRPTSLKVASTSGVQDGKRRVLPSSFFFNTSFLLLLRIPAILALVASRPPSLRFWLVSKIVRAVLAFRKRASMNSRATNQSQVLVPITLLLFRQSVCVDRILAVQNLWDTRVVLVCQTFRRLGVVTGESEILSVQHGIEFTS